VRSSAWRPEWMPGAWADVDRAGDWLEELAAIEAPDLIHFNDYCHAARGWSAPVVVVGHSCVWSWWRAVRGGDPPAAWREYRRQVQAGLLAADRVVAPTRAMLSELERAYGPLPHGRVVWNGRAWRWRPGATAVAGRFPLVMSTGRMWDEAKNLALLECAAAQVSWPIAVAGEDHDPGGALVGAERLTLLGRLSTHELASWLERAAIYASPARYQPFGLAALEAAQAGCALVLGDIASQRELWAAAAVYVPPDDPAALARALNRLIGDPERLRGLATAARIRAGCFHAAGMADRYLAVYREARVAAGLATEVHRS
jgi:glycogen synthase